MEAKPTEPTPQPLKFVLAFNNLKKLTAIYASAYHAAKALQGGTNSVVAVCTGKMISYKGYYFRYAYTYRETSVDDLNERTLADYDEWLGLSRKVYEGRNMTRRGMKYAKKPPKNNPYWPYRDKEAAERIKKGHRE